jgi:hypothetical protein
MTYGNNVFAVDDVRRKWRWVPKPIRQLYYRAIGVMPEYLIVNDAHAGRAKSLASRRFALVGVAVLLLVMILPQILTWIICRIRPRAGVCGRRSIAADEMRQVRSARP